jgi:hypothetical protein
MLIVLSLFNGIQMWARIVAQCSSTTMSVWRLKCLQFRGRASMVKEIPPHYKHARLQNHLFNYKYLKVAGN